MIPYEVFFCGWIIYNVLPVFTYYDILFLHASIDLWQGEKGQISPDEEVYICNSGRLPCLAHLKMVDGSQRLRKHMVWSMKTRSVSLFIFKRYGTFQKR